MSWDARDAFDPVAMRGRRSRLHALIRSQRRAWFHPDGSRRPEMTEADSRIAVWALPAFLHGDADDREFARKQTLSDPALQRWGVFETSVYASLLVRDLDRLPEGLAAAFTEHLARFTEVDAGRAPGSAANDYVFHGYNDNMPAMAVRTMVLAGEVLNRPQLIDRGRFHLEGLLAHFQRRGLLSEHTSGTYSPITLNALADLAELTTTPDIRSMATLCCRRILIDLWSFWHPGLGALAGAQSRAYTVDMWEGFSNVNSFMWYVTGHPLLIDPIEALDGAREIPDAVMHHGRCLPFNAAQACELMVANHDWIDAELIEWIRSPRPSNFTVQATTDGGQSQLLGGVSQAVCRAVQRPLWGLGTRSTTWFDHSGQMANLHAVFAMTPEPASWRERAALNVRLLADGPDTGEAVPNWCGVLAEADGVRDVGRHHTAQSQGSAMFLSTPAPHVLGREVRNLRLQIALGVRHRQPDEMWENDTPLTCWEGGFTARDWQFVRFGKVYLGLRMAAQQHGNAGVCRRSWAHGYLRLEAFLNGSEPLMVTSEVCEWADSACVVELGDADHDGSFADFRQACQQTSWEVHHAFYRTARFRARGGDLQLVDSCAAYSLRYISIDGQVEAEPLFTATGLDSTLLEIGAVAPLRRLFWDSGYIRSPHYDLHHQTLVCDPTA